MRQETCKSKTQLQYLTHNPIDTSEWHLLSVDGRDGAAFEFRGIVRAEEGTRRIQCLDYEAYEPMAERLIAQVIAQSTKRWTLHQVYVRHRIGRVCVGEISVLIGVHAPHRDQAFEACRFIIDAIKLDVPIWKKAYDGES